MLALLIWSALSFTPNDGKWQAHGQSLSLDAQGVTLPGARLEYLGASGFLEGEEQLSGVVNRYRGQQRREGLPRFARLRQRSAWPGVDLIYYGAKDGGQQLEMDFVLAPGANLDNVKIDLDGAKIDPGSIKIDPGSVKIDPGSVKIGAVPDGSLRLVTARGEIELRAPQVYQVKNGVRQIVASRYVVKGDRIGFAVARYDRRRPLVIDPVIGYSTYFGGGGEDFINGSAVDSSGALYVTGFTSSADLPLPSPSPAPPFNALSGSSDAFVAKIAPGGNTLEWVTYLGGSSDDQGRGIALDGTNAFVVGYTSSVDFPLKQPLQAGFGGGSLDAFVAKLSATGTLQYATYLGGTGDDFGSAIAADSTGAAYVAGDSNGPFPSPAPHPTKGDDGWVVKLGPSDGSSAPALVYVKLIGGSDVDFAQGVAVDGSRSAYVTGATSSNDFPLCQNGPCPTPSPASMRPGRLDTFVAKLTPAGDQLVYSRLVGGDNDDIGRAIAVEPTGAAYVTGLTDSANFPTVNALQASFGSAAPGNPLDNDAFVFKLGANGTTLAYSTFLGGNSDDEASSLSIDSSGAAYIGGSTFSTNFPVTATAVMATLPNPGGSAFVAKLSPQGNALAWGTYFGGSDGGSSVLAMASDSLGDTWASGFTDSTDLPQKNPVTGRHAPGEAFIVELVPGAEPPVVSAISPPSAPANTNTAVTISGANFVAGVTVSFDGAACAGLLVVNAETITCTTPRHDAGTVTVLVTNPDGQHVSLPYPFDPPSAPALLGLAPSSGSISGGTLVTISGAKISAAATVSFDGNPAASVSVIDSTRVLVTTPPHAAGAVDVVVSNGSGLEATLAQAFTYVIGGGDSPSISAITPSSGPVEGGTHVTIAGNNFAAGAGVTIASAAATGVMVVDAQTILAVTPPGTAGPADVVVADPNGQRFTLTGGFTYGSSSSALSVVSVVPASGSINGGDKVMVLGAGFTSGAQVSFGGSDATNVQLVDATQLQVTTPAHVEGAVDVTVRTLDGQAARLSSGFAYKNVESGCGCRVGGRSDGNWAWLLLFFLLLRYSSSSTSSVFQYEASTSPRKGSHSR